MGDKYAYLGIVNQGDHLDTEGLQCISSSSSARAQFLLLRLVYRASVAPIPDTEDGWIIGEADGPILRVVACAGSLGKSGDLFTPSCELC